MGATYWLVPGIAYRASFAPRLRLATRVGDPRGRDLCGRVLFGWTEGNKLLEQPLPIKLGIVVVMLMFLYKHRNDYREGEAAHHHGGVLIAGLALTAFSISPHSSRTKLHGEHLLPVGTVHLWSRGCGNGHGGLLAYLLIRLSGADREVMEKWLYVIVGLTFIAGSSAPRTTTSGSVCRVTG